MGRRLVVTLLGLFVCKSALLLAADTFEVDSTHSSVIFQVKRLGVVNYYGRFNGLTGSITVDQESPEKSSVVLEIKTEAVDTNNQRRDDHLRSPDFFNSTQFPAIQFKSTQIRRVSENRFEVTGELSLHGVTRTLTTEVVQTGQGTHPRRGTPLIGFETTLVLKRSDYGMTYMIPDLSDEVRIILAVHGVAG